VHRRLVETAPGRLAGIAATMGLAAGGSPERAAARVRAVADPDAGVIEQFEGYFTRRELPIESWDDNDMPRYPRGYHHTSSTTRRARCTSRR
jgi:kojibiose phosphorylase